MTFFLARSDAGDSDKFYKKAAEHREPFKPLLDEFIKDALGNENRMSDDVLDNLLQRSNILKELIAMGICSREKNDRVGEMSGHYNLLTFLGNAR